MIRLIGDSHGQYTQYYNKAIEADYSIQLGDFGFDYSVLQELDSDRHKFITGNHDDHDVAYDVPHCLGRFGTAKLDNLSFFFVSGGFSLDYRDRIVLEKAGRGRSWWENEALSLLESLECIELYKEAQPDVVISHAVPGFLAKNVGNPRILKSFGYDPIKFTTQTQELLDQLFIIHEPREWYMGHFHTSYEREVAGCKFKILNILETYDLHT